MESGDCRPERTRTTDTVLDTLGNRTRRAVIDYFEPTTSSTATATIEELITHLVGRRPAADCHRLRTSLYHHHLPKLQARGWLGFDRRTEQIRYDGHDAAEEVLDEVGAIFQA